MQPLALPKSLERAIKATVFDGPIRLLRLSDMKLLSRFELIEEVTKRCATFTYPSMMGTQEARDVAFVHYKYAILSHRWASRELSMGDIRQIHADTPHSATLLAQDANFERTAPAYRKIINFSAKAQELGCFYAWFDSGCIDQSSSAELDESLRSMYNWYQRADVCLVHLAETHSKEDLRDDEWFERGWTLQELIAPRRLKFFCAEWTEMAEVRLDALVMNKDEAWIWDQISYASGSSAFFSNTCIFHISCRLADLDRDEITRFRPHTRNARKILTWTAVRRTTRPEDRVYSLLGLLGLDIPIRYGEGFDRAFFRLQIEILQHTDNRSLFVWAGPPSPYHSMLVAHPVYMDDELEAPLIADFLFRDQAATDQSLPLTNCGLRIHMSVYPLESLVIEKARDPYMMDMPLEPHMGPLILHTVSQTFGNIDVELHGYWDGLSTQNTALGIIGGSGRSDAVDDPECGGPLNSDSQRRPASYFSKFTSKLAARRRKNTPEPSQSNPRLVQHAACHPRRLYAILIKRDDFENRLPLRHLRIPTKKHIWLSWPSDGAPLRSSEAVHVTEHPEALRVLLE